MDFVANLNSTATLREKGHPLGPETGATILVVEDARKSRQTWSGRSFKETIMFSVLWTLRKQFKSAEKALPAVVLTDSDLPTLDRLLVLFSEHNYLKEVPVVIIDVDELKLDDERVQVLTDFEALDRLIDSPRPRQT